MVSKLFQFIPIVLVLVVMASAAVHDIRTREVPDGHWAVLGALSVVVSSGFSVPTAVGTGLLALYMCSRRVEGPLAVMVLSASMVSFAVACLMDPSQSHVNIGIPVMFLLGLLFYITGLLKGGADAKAFMSLSLAVPVYPSLQILWGPVYPQAYLMPPSMAVLLVALSLTLVPMIALFIINLFHGYRGRGMATTYTLPLDVASESHVWPVEDVTDGMIRRCPPSEDSGVYDRLRAAGAVRVRVTPMIPFLLPMAVASVVVLILGNPFMAMFA